jgi:hypothetical protein
LQIIQNKLDAFLLNVVPNEAFTPASEQQLRGVLLEVFGNDVNIEVAKVERLSQERNSKYRFAICKV